MPKISYIDYLAIAHERISPPPPSHPPGETNLDSLMTSLITAVDEHHSHTEQEAAEERGRLARVRMIAEQNQAYQDSLDADREKVRTRGGGGGGGLLGASGLL